jgi:hypothetical protein
MSSNVHIEDPAWLLAGGLPLQNNYSPFLQDQSHVSRMEEQNGNDGNFEFSQAQEGIQHYRNAMVARSNHREEEEAASREQGSKNDHGQEKASSLASASSLSSAFDDDGSHDDSHDDFNSNHRVVHHNETIVQGLHLTLTNFQSKLSSTRKNDEKN